MLAICHRMKQYGHITTAMRFAEGLLKRSAPLTSRGEARQGTALLLELRSRLVVARTLAFRLEKLAGMCGCRHC
jgi:hypothetical protein